MTYKIQKTKLDGGFDGLPKSTYVTEPNGRPVEFETEAEAQAEVNRLTEAAEPLVSYDVLPPNKLPKSW